MIRRLYRSVASNKRNRDLVLASIICLTLFYILPYDVVSESESVALGKYMNSGRAVLQPLKAVKSSVDWSKVEYRYPPGTITPLPEGPARELPRIQHAFPPESASEARIRQERRRAVLERTRKDWNSYRKYAWKRDALLPLSRAGRDQFSGWAATLVDSLDTLWIMGLKEEFDEAVAAVADIDFGRSTTGSVNIFETTIRNLGGLLAAYDLSKRPVLLEKAIELGDFIYGGFNTEHRMPVDMIDFEAAKNGTGLNVEYKVVSASPGTLTMEMTRLSQITGDAKYYDAISRVVDLFHDGQNKTALPGMFPMYVFMGNRDVTTGSAFTLAGCADSLYEYFPKMHLLLGGLEAKYETLTRGFLKPAKEHLFFRPMLPDNADILISGNVNILSDGEPALDPESEHLACFAGGTFALAGRLLDSKEDVEVGAKLARGCAYAYQAFPTGLMPERFNMVVCKDKENCEWDEEKWVEGRSQRPEWKEHLPKGFTTAKDPRYILRPEAIESIFYLWRITGQKEWQDYAWAMWEAVANGTRTRYASAAVLDVTVARDLLQQEDYMEVSLQETPGV